MATRKKTKSKVASVKETIFESREAWMVGRLGKVTGSAVKDTVNFKDGATKPGVYRAVAESMIGSATIAEDDLTSTQVMERGHELEPRAIERFEKETGKKVRRGLILWERNDDSRMAVSPDGSISETEAIEVKCLLSTKHVEALFTKAIPKNTAGYEEQLAQYFIVNEALETVYYVFYHPDFPTGLDYLCLTFTREEMQEDIDRILSAERGAVSKVREIVNALTLYSPEEIAKANEVKEELLATNAEVVAKAIKRVRSKQVGV